MDKQIKALLEKYLDGTSTNAEEQQLLDLISREQPTAELKALATMLGSKREVDPNQEWTKQVFVLTKPIPKRLMRWAIAAAAAVIAAVFVVMRVQRNTDKPVQADITAIANTAETRPLVAVNGVSAANSAEVVAKLAQKKEKAASSHRRANSDACIVEQKQAELHSDAEDVQEEAVYDGSDACQELAERFAYVEDICVKTRENLINTYEQYENI